MARAPFPDFRFEKDRPTVNRPAIGAVRGEDHPYTSQPIRPSRELQTKISFFPARPRKERRIATNRASTQNAKQSVPGKSGTLAKGCMTL
jgi:hypothetical protein